MAVPPTAATSNGKPADVPERDALTTLRLTDLCVDLRADLSTDPGTHRATDRVTQLGSDIFEGRRCAPCREARSSSETGSDETHSSVSRTAPMGMLFRQTILPAASPMTISVERPADIDGR